MNWQWLKETLLTYLSDWREWINNNPKIPEGAKKTCFLPDQTVEGLQICGESIKYLMMHNNWCTWYIYIAELLYIQYHIII